ncbi:MAG: LCP family protein [Propionibacterium sp.]
MTQEGPERHARRAQPAPHRMSRTARIVRLVALVLAVLLVVTVAAVGIYLWRADSGIKRSSAISKSGGSSSGELNLLVMGLDSRVDVNGNALPANIYDALHAGDEDDGGLNSNVLMYVHIPADGSAATVIAIPRDDYVDLPGCPDGECKGKIKEAYGLAADQKSKELSAQGKTDSAAYQQTRDAGRAAEVATVEQFLGVQIDHFVEVTMVAFLQIAQVVQPITVCVKENTVDTYSGANFTAGVQQINADQAMAFVRQRRDTSNPDLAFTDLDRSRRQQAFIASLFTKLKQTNFLTNPTKLDSLVKVAQQNTVIDSQLSISDLTSLASSMDGSKMHFYTLPIQSFGTDAEGQSVNIVDTATIRGIVANLVKPATSSSSSASATPTSAPSSSADTTFGKGTTVSVVNASGVGGAASSLISELSAYGFTAGQASTSADQVATSSLSYGSGAEQAAQKLASMTGIETTSENSSLGTDQIEVTIGTEFDWGSSSATSSSSSVASSALPSAVQATGGGSAGPEPTQLTEITGGGVPCVK